MGDEENPGFSHGPLVNPVWFAGGGVFSFLVWLRVLVEGLLFQRNLPLGSRVELAP